VALSVVLALSVLVTGCATAGSFCWSDLDPGPEAAVQARSSVRKAYRLLEETERFASVHVGIAGAPSCQVMAFQALLRSRDAAGAFSALVDNGTLEGQLYGLAGLYLTDRPAFDRLLPRYATMTDSVRTEFGCVWGAYPVSVIVVGTEPIEPSDLAQWHEDNPLAEYPPVDLASGGWSLEFKNAYR